MGTDNVDQCEFLWINTKNLTSISGFCSYSHFKEKYTVSYFQNHQFYLGQVIPSIVGQILEKEAIF